MQLSKTKKTERGTSIHRKNDRELWSCKDSDSQTFVQISAIIGRAKGGKKLRNCEHADRERRIKMVDEHLKLLTMARTILFYKNYEKTLLNNRGHLIRSIGVRREVI